jgi:DNA repair photolyase
MFRPIYEPRNRAREYCDLAVNIYTGCPHGCLYCYAPKVLRKSREEFAKVSPRKDIVEAVEWQLKRDKITGRKIMLCFTCDPYPIGIGNSETRDVIRAIKESGNHVQILTKGSPDAVEDFDLLDENDSFGVSITGAPKYVEPRASDSVDLLEMLFIAHHHGIKTWVSCEPVFDPAAIYRLIKTVYYIDMFRIGKLNYMPSNIDWGKFGRECERLCKEYGRNYYIKEDLRKEMEVPG